jgi:ferredoxin-NADP reductase
MGKFVLPEIIDRDLYLICTGTGIAPFRSMVHHIKNHHIHHKNIYLIFGTRVIPDLLYPGEMQGLHEEMETFTTCPYAAGTGRQPSMASGRAMCMECTKPLFSQNLFNHKLKAPIYPHPPIFIYVAGKT